MGEATAQYISEMWADDTADAVQFGVDVSILVSPAYPHRRRWQWWHIRHCAGCRQADRDWPEQKRKFWEGLIWLT